jgi:hypothetical protein
MERSIPPPASEGAVVTLDAVLARLAAIPDHRHARGRRYALPVLLLIVLAKLAGEDHPSGIAD